MAAKQLGAARLFASYYQLVVCDDPSRPLPDEHNWNKDKHIRGFAGYASFRMIGTEADSNVHWVELVASESPPKLDVWQRVTCVSFHSSTGQVHIMSVIGDRPVISAAIDPGDYSVYVASQNLGIDQRSLHEEHALTDAELAKRRDLEWHRIFIVLGLPEREGRLKDA